MRPSSWSDSRTVFDLTGALEQIQRMGNTFVQRIPYLLVALLVFAGFYIAAKVLRGVTYRVFRRRTRHRNVGFVIGRLAQGVLVVLGLLVALVIALPSFRPGQLVAIQRTLGANGIDLPFETRVVLFHDQTEETDGDRGRQREGWPAGGGEAPRPRSVAAALRELSREAPAGDGRRG